MVTEGPNRGHPIDQCVQSELLRNPKHTHAVVWKPLSA